MRQAQVQALKRVCILVCQVYGRPLGSFPDHIGREKAACYSLFVHNESVSLPVFQVMSCCMVIIMLSIYYPLQLLQVVLSILLVHGSLAGTYLL